MHRSCHILESIARRVPSGEAITSDKASRLNMTITTSPTTSWATTEHIVRGLFFQICFCTLLTLIQSSELRQRFPRQVFEEKDSVYKSLQDSYWSGNQRNLKPRCFFQPHSAEDLAQAVALCAKARCPFAVKSGGHGHFAGQSCLDGGVQLDLAKLNTISIDRRRGTVFVGSGCTWRSVYTKLQGEGLIAVGGRSADVGVGGFLVGGT